MNFKNLNSYFLTKKRLMRLLKKYEVKKLSKKKRHWVKDNNAPILLVAHIDTVQKPHLNHDGFTGAGFDDRLGVYLAMSLSRRFPKMFDMLLTDFEETGKSTAKYFNPTHNYNFVVGLDREGTDFVDYGLASDEFLDLFKKTTNIKQGIGSFSDICSLENVICSKINLGIGVYKSHSPESCFFVEEMKSQISKLVAFCREYRDKYFIEGPGEYYGNILDFSSFGDDYDLDPPVSDIVEECEDCRDIYYLEDLYMLNNQIFCEHCLYDHGLLDLAMPLDINGPGNFKE